LPGAALTAASDGQHQLEREAAQLPGPSDAQHLVRLTSEIISEVAEHQADR
jgi:hypothetical protein